MKLKHQDLIDLTAELGKAFVRSNARITHILVDGNIVSLHYLHYVKTIENLIEEILLTHFMVNWELKKQQALQRLSNESTVKLKKLNTKY